MKIKAVYWVTTLAVAAVMLLGGVMDTLRAAPVVETMNHLGYPAYVASILGVWKLLGGFAILAPGLPRVKEWAYAGIAFDLTGAAISHGAAGDPTAKVVVPLVLLGLAIVSWALRPTSRRLEDPRTENQPRVTSILRSVISSIA
jgi:hypothetical protein